MTCGAALRPSSRAVTSQHSEVGEGQVTEGLGFAASFLSHPYNRLLADRRDIDPRTGEISWHLLV